MKKYRLTVIVSDFGAAANVGGAVETITRTFDLPEEISAYIERNVGTYTAIAFGYEEQEPTK